jgi:hypothetical protein
MIDQTSSARLFLRIATMLFLHAAHAGADESPPLETFGWMSLPSQVSAWVRDAGASDGWAPWPIGVAPRTADGRDRLDGAGIKPWDRLEFPPPPPVPLGWLGNLPPGCDRPGGRALARPDDNPLLLVCPSAYPDDRRPPPEAVPWSIEGDLQNARIRPATGQIGAPARAGFEIRLAILGRAKAFRGSDLAAAGEAEIADGRTRRSRQRWSLPVGSAGAPQLVEESTSGPEGLIWRLRLWFAEGVRGLSGSLTWRPPLSTGGSCPLPDAAEGLEPLFCARLNDDPDAVLVAYATAALAAQTEASPLDPALSVPRLETLPAGEHIVELRLTRSSARPAGAWQVRRIR